MAVKEIQASDFKQEVAEGLVLVKFGATWCGPCRMLAPVLEELAQEVTDVKFTEVDVDKNPELASELGIMGVPNMMLYKNGEFVDRKVGFTSKNDIMSWINEHK